MTNRLLYVTPEINQIRAQIANTGSTLLLLKETEGKLKLKLVEGKYFLKVLLTIPEEYPVKPVEVNQHSMLIKITVSF